MTTYSPDLITQLAQIGFRASRDALAAFLTHPRKIDRELVERLFTLDFIGRGDNVLLRGQSGVGKTMLAKNLGHAALLAC